MSASYERYTTSREEQGERPLTPIHEQIISGRSVWDGSSFRSKDEFAFDLSAKHVSGLEDVLSRLKGVPTEEIERKDCSHPALDADFAKILQETHHGRGFTLVRGMPVGDSYSQEDIQRMLWIFCTHLGDILSGNVMGQKIFTIRQWPGGTPVGSSKEGQELAFHADSGDFFSLLCVRQARAGGETKFASVASIHNDILERHPEVLPILYRGFPNHRRGNQLEGQAEITPYNVPIFANVAGKVSIGSFAIGSIFAGLEGLGRTITELEERALRTVVEAATRLQVKIRFNPGEMSVVHNRAVLHSRSSFTEEDDPEKGRLLYRIWIGAREGRWPAIPEMWGSATKDGRGGTDRIPGRTTDSYPVPDNIRLAIQRGQKLRAEEPEGLPVLV